MFRITCFKIFNKTLVSGIEGNFSFKQNTLFRHKCYYKILGVETNSSLSEIKEAYYKLSKVHHPDMNAGVDDATGKIQEINEAFEVLGNAKIKQQYDAQRTISLSEGLQKSHGPFSKDARPKFYYYEQADESPFYNFEQQESDKKYQIYRNCRFGRGALKRKRRHQVMKMMYHKMIGDKIVSKYYSKYRM